MKRLLLVSAFGLCAVLLPVRSARAQGSAQADLTVTATVLGICTIDPATLGFGNYNPVDGDHDGSGTITVNCTEGTAYWIGLDLGSNSIGTTRYMAGGSSEVLEYELYRDGGRTDVWDDTDGGLGTTTATPAIPTAGYSPYPVPVYGRIIGTQPVSAGLYSDTVKMTVHF